ncbi:MAG: type II CRISPR RNA-guided endonuclease Cas9, partial [Clostridia bacterium]|nr:type II CRISPR RNA-guided endonuclease Cas9 [Clostridia bacterium]
VTNSDIAEWLNKNENLKLSKSDITGLREDDHLANIYKPYRDFKRILGDNFSEKNIQDIYEEIVKILTIFDVNDKQTRMERIEKALDKDKNNAVSQNQIMALAKLNYNGWGRFSEKVLNGIYSKEDNRRTVIQVMRDTVKNFMEITATKNSPYGFYEQMQPQKQDIENFYADCIENSYCSPAVKKSTNQAIKLIKEIIKIVGHAPSAVYLESASGEELNKKGKRTKSKADTLKELYDKVTKSARDEDYERTKIELKTRIDDEKARNIKSNESAFNKEKLYLYFTQLGKCMYSGDSLDVSQLDKYEVDHIIPQSLIKDDSRDNKVLVKKIENQNKTDNLTLSKDVIARMTATWKKLLRMNFISKKKFYALTRESFDERDIEQFIERQLVETRQTVKVVGDIVKLLPELDGCEVVKVPAKSCNNLKSALGYFKVRELNDYHHAKDAYIACVFGRFAQNTVSKNNGGFRQLYRKGIQMSLNDGGRGKSQKLRHGLVVNMMNLRFGSILRTANEEYDEKGNLLRQELQMLSPDGEIIWSSTYRENVLRTLNYNDCLLTKKIEEEANSDFYDQTIYGKNSSKSNLIPRKMAVNKFGKKVDLPPQQYGGYSSISSAYAIAIEYKKGKKYERKIVNIPLLNVYKNNVDEYLKHNYGEYTVLKDKICKNQMLIYKGQLCYYVSESELNNATQIKGKQYWQEALSKIAKANERKTWLCKDNMTDEEYTKINRQMRAFVDDFLDQLGKKYFALYNDIAKNIKEGFVDKGGFDALSFELKQSFIFELLKITSTAGRTDKLKDYIVTVDGETLTIKGSSLGRLTQKLNLDDITFVNRSITGFWEKKIPASQLRKDKK